MYPRSLDPSVLAFSLSIYRLSAREREDLGHGKGVGDHDALLTDTRRRVVSLAENAVRIPGVEPVWFVYYKRESEGQRDCVVEKRSETVDLVCLL